MRPVRGGHATSEATEVCELLDWDTGFWGVPIARVAGSRLTATRLAEVDDWCRRRGVACACFLAQSDDFATLQLAEAGGFGCVDIRVTLACRPDPGLELAGGSQVREFEERDREEVARLARTSYRLTRFYNDPHFPNKRCGEFYERWVVASCNGLADRVWVAEADGRIAGYMTCVLDRERSAGRLVLTAVAQDGRGHGLGLALVVTAVEWLRRNGAQEVRGSTQAANVTMQRILQRAGFFADSTELWFHKWYEHAGVSPAEPMTT